VTLHERIAQALGWTEEEAKGFSFQALRDLVRPVNPKLAHELTLAIQSGDYIMDSVGLLRGTDDQDMDMGDA
jgi:hypothetical protein